MLARCVKVFLVLPLGSGYPSLSKPFGKSAYTDILSLAKLRFVRGLTSDVAADQILMCADDLDLLSLRNRSRHVAALNLTGSSARDRFHDVDLLRALKIRER